MKLLVQKFFILFLVSVCIYPQTWQQTAGTPEGSGVTDMIVRQVNQHVFVTTGSFNWPNGDMGGVRRSTDEGVTWENLNNVFVARTIIDAPDGNLYASIWDFPQDEGLYRSTDNGNNWGTPLVSVPSGDNIFSIALNTTTTPNTIFAGTRNGPLRSTDNGVSWAPVTNGIPANSWVRDIEVDSGGYVVAATTNGLFSSTNNGDLWEQATGIAAGDTIVKLLFDYPSSTENAFDNTRLLGGSDDGNVYEAVRESKYLFATLGALLGPSEISGLFVGVLQGLNKQMHGAGTFPKGSFGIGFYTSTDDGVTWQQNNNGLQSNPPISALAGYTEVSRGSMIDVHFYIGYFENMNGGARTFHTKYTVTDVEQVSSDIPTNYQLEQNYPNPFNPSTKIQFSIPQTSYVVLRVLNTLGQSVGLLVSQELITGTYNYNWDATNFPSGVYFYHIKAGDFIETKKMILLR